MRLGIYGGTFSPPHTGHTEAARAFADAMALDKLLIIPTHIPPHKLFGEEASSLERLEMCRLAFSGIPHAEISDMEIKRGGKSYTYLTLEELKNEADELYFLCGTDMLLTLDEWKNFERVFELATICYVRREANPEIDTKIENKIKEYVESYSARIIKIPHTAIEISSTELREAISLGNGATMLPARVYDFIEQRGLYR